MKKIILVLLAGVFLSVPAFAQDSTDEETVRELTALRKKLGVMKREMDLLMKDIMSSASAAAGAVQDSFVDDVRVDISQTDKNIIVKADLPGMQKDKITVTLENKRFLKIAGSREMMKSEKSPTIVKQERFYGHFEKTMELPADVLNSGIDATYKDGVLEITIPKKSRTAEETVKINVK